MIVRPPRNGHNVEHTPLPENEQADPCVERLSRKASTVRALISAVVALVVGLALVGWTLRGTLDNAATKGDVGTIMQRLVEVEADSRVNQSEHRHIIDALGRMETKLDKLGGE